MSKPLRNFLQIHSCADHLLKESMRHWFGEKGYSGTTSALWATADPEGHEARIRAIEARVSRDKEILRLIGCKICWDRDIDDYMYPCAGLADTYIALLSPYTQKQLPAKGGLAEKPGIRMCPLCKKTELQKHCQYCKACSLARKTKPKIRRWCPDCKIAELMNFRQTYCSDCARIRRRATANRFYYNHRKPRLCPDCGKRNAKKFKTLCEPCRAKHRKRSDALYDLKHKS